MQKFLKMVGNGQRTARDLTAEEADEAITLILNGTATPAQVGAFMAAQRIKEESSDELAVFTRVLRRLSVQVAVNDPALIDVCVPYDGRAKSPSLIVAAALIAAAAGAKIALHGRPGQSTPPKFGVTVGDILACLHIPIDLPLQAAAKLLTDESIGMTFVASTQFSPVLERFNNMRYEYGMRSFFNTIEKLLNPFGATNALVGVFHGPVLGRVAQAMQAQGYTRGIAVQGPEGSVDVFCSRRTPLQEFGPDNPIPTAWTIDPAQFNWWDQTDLPQNVTAQANAELTLELIQPKPGELNVLQRGSLMTAALMLYATGNVVSFQNALAQAHDALLNGAAQQRLERLQSVSRAISSISVN